MAAERAASPRRARRAVAIGVLAVAAAAAPGYAMLSTPDAAPQAKRCLAWFGSKMDGQCIAWSNSGGTGQVSGGLPAVSVGGPNSGNPGFSTGPMLPGQTINIPIPVG